MEAVTITLPAIDESVIANLNTETLSLNSTAVLAVQALREKYTPLAKHAGFIRTGYESASTANTSWERTAYYYGGKSVRMHGLLCADDFDFTNGKGSEFRGAAGGSQLWLTEEGQWLELVRTGHWSNWQGEHNGWACGDVCWPEDGDTEAEPYDGQITMLRDEEVASQYNLAAIIERLGKSLSDMAEKLPQRLIKVRQEATLASELLVALKGGKS